MTRIPLVCEFLSELPVFFVGPCYAGAIRQTGALPFSLLILGSCVLCIAENGMNRPDNFRAVYNRIRSQFLFSSWVESICNALKYHNRRIEFHESPFDQITQTLILTSS